MTSWKKHLSMKNVVPESMWNHTRNNGINVPITRHAMSIRKTAVACLFVVLLHHSPHNALQAISSPFVCLTLTTYHLTRLNAVYVPCSASQTINTAYTYTHTRIYARVTHCTPHRPVLFNPPAFIPATPKQDHITANFKH